HGPVVWPGAGLPRVGRGTLHRLLAAARARDTASPTGPPWPLCGCSVGGPYSAHLGGLALPRRRVPQGLGPAAAWRAPHVTASGVAPDAGPPVAGPPAGRAPPTPQNARM